MADIDTAIDDHLDSLNTTLFGQAFDLSSDTRRAEARRWLRRQIEAVAARAASAPLA